MVKGNAERRRELAAARCADKQAELQRKKAGPVAATASEVRARLLSDERLNGDTGPSLTAWVVASEGEKQLCSSFVRTGSCPLKRCKFSHDITLSALSGMPKEAETGAEKDNGLPPLCTVPLREVGAQLGGTLVYNRTVRTHVRSASNLVFIASGSDLAFDAASPSVFVAHCARQKQRLAEASTDAALTPAAAAQIDLGDGIVECASTDRRPIAEGEG